MPYVHTPYMFVFQFGFATILAILTSRSVEQSQFFHFLRRSSLAYQLLAETRESASSILCFCSSPVLEETTMSKRASCIAF